MVSEGARTNVIDLERAIRGGKGEEDVEEILNEGCTRQHYNY